MKERIAVMLAAHGAGDASDANARIRSLANDVAARIDRPVVASFNLGNPSYEAGLMGVMDVARHSAPRVIVVPLMTSNGYFARRIVPRRIHEANQSRANRPRASIFFTPAAGAAPSVISALANRTAQTIKAHTMDPLSTTILVIGHGTDRSKKSARSTYDLTRAISARLARARVRPAFLDQEPRLKHAALAIETPNVIILPYLLGGGHHAAADIIAPLGLPESHSPNSRRAIAHDGRRYLFERPLLDEPILREGVVACVNRAHSSLATRKEEAA